MPFGLSKSTIRPLLIAALFAAAACTPATAQTKRAFVFLGDTPYSDAQVTTLRSVIAPKIIQDGFPFVVHYGDFKAGGEACKKSLIEEHHKNIMSLWGNRESGETPLPVFYTPGDNEWTDCDREFKSGKSKSELGSLDFLRRTFFSKPQPLPEEWAFKRQALYPENALWRHSKIQFGTVHLTGTNNGRIEIRKDDVATALAQVDARDAANRVWLKNIFSKATKFRNQADAVIITTQADVTDPDESASCTADNRMNCDAFAGFRAQLLKHAAAFGKPVLLVHGDTNPYCLDKAFGGAVAPNLWRLNAGGDYHEPLDATVVTVDPVNLSAPFSAKGLVAGEVPADGC